MNRRASPRTIKICDSVRSALTTDSPTGGRMKIGEELCQICLAMGGAAAFSTERRETDRERCICVDAMDDLLRSAQLANETLDFSDGLRGSCDHEESNGPGIGSTDIQSELHDLFFNAGRVVASPASVVLTEGTLSQSGAMLSCPTPDGMVLDALEEDAEEVKSSFLNSEALGEANGHAQEKFNHSAETDGTGVLSKLELSPAQQSAQGLRTLRANLGGRIHAFSLEALNWNVELESELQRLENVLQQQESVLTRKDEENATLKVQGQRSLELITQLQSQAAKIPEYLDMMSKIKAALGQDEIPASEIGESFVKLYRDKDRQLEDLRKSCLDKDMQREELRKRNSQLELSKRDVALKTREIEQLKKDIHVLKESTIQLEDKFQKIQRQPCKERPGYDGSYVDGMKTPLLLESTAKDVFSSIATFSKAFSKYTNPHGHNPAQSFISAVLPKVYLTRPHHWTSLLKSWICDRMFGNFESEIFVPSRNTALFLNHEDRASRCFGYFERSNKRRALNPATCDEGTRKFDSLFEDYFVSISQALLPSDIQQLYTCFTMQGGLSADAKDLLPECGAKLEVVQSLVIAAKKVWDFHKLCLSFEPPATIFRVAAGEPFDQNYMDSKVALEIDPKFAPKVGFMIYPGFRLQKSIIKCEIYFGSQT